MTPYEDAMEKKRRAMEGGAIEPAIRRVAAGGGGGSVGTAPAPVAAPLTRAPITFGETPGMRGGYRPPSPEQAAANPVNKWLRTIPEKGLLQALGASPGPLAGATSIPDLARRTEALAHPSAAPAVVVPTTAPLLARIQPFNQPASAVPAPAAKPVAAGGYAAANPEDVVGTFNGRTITKGESDRLAGGTSFGNAGAAPAQGVVPMLARAPSSYQAPGTNLGGNTGGADTERKALIQRLGVQLDGIGKLDTRGKRDLAGQILTLQSGLTRDAFDQAGDLTKAGAQLNVDAGKAALDANSRADETGATLAADANENALKRKFEFDNSGTTVRGADGGVYLQRGTTAAPVLGPDGKPFKGGPDKSEGGVTPEGVYKSLAAERAAILANAVDPASAKTLLDAYDASPRGQQLASMESQALGGAAAPAAGAKTVARTGTTPDGRKVIQYSDGTTEVAPR